ANRRLASGSTCSGPGQGEDRVVRDVTGDGIPDVFSRGAGAISVWVGQGGCAFGAEHRTPTPGLVWSWFGTIDTDPLVDVVYVVQGNIALARATGPGDFGSPALVPYAGHVDGIATGDFSGDGLPDLLVIDQTARKITVFNQGTMMQFAPTQTLTWLPTDQEL